MLERRWGRKLKVGELLLGDSYMTYLQADWMRKQDDGEVRHTYTGLVDRATLRRLGLDDEMANALAQQLERSLATTTADEEAWTRLGLNGDERTIRAVHDQLQWTYGCGTDKLIGCDGGLKYRRDGNGKQRLPRADWCVADGTTHVWVSGKLEGAQNICDAEFMAKTVATMVCIDEADRVLIYDSQASGRRYQRAQRTAKDNLNGVISTVGRRSPARTMIRSCAKVIAARTHPLTTRWCKSHKEVLETPDDYSNDSADRGCTHSRRVRKMEVCRLRNGCDDFFISRDGYGIVDEAIYDEVYEQHLLRLSAKITTNKALVNIDTIWAGPMKAVRQHSTCKYGDFAAKGASSALPTSTRMRRIYGEEVVTDTTCPLCGEAPDTQTHLLCHCKYTQKARDQIYTRLVCAIATITNKSAGEIRKIEKSCWEGTTTPCEKTPLGALTYLGYLPNTLRKQLRTVGLKHTQVSTLGADTARHAVRITHELMWLVRCKAMGVMQRDIAASLRRAGKVCGVAPTTVNVNVDDAIEAYEEL